MASDVTAAPPPLGPEDSTRLVEFARACKAAARAVTLYPDGHPAIAATLACGYLGIRDRIEPSPECTDDAYRSGYSLSRSLGEALQLLRDDQTLREILVDDFVTVYTEVKEAEHDEFMKVISPWEREHLLLHV